ncbi:hypothetical protein B1R32_11438 [Abditibacterium utsteinense]|uniref:Uncharacterized protein n=1 Tax=Abditibacterium utsteinense TaxID=1960156 RepID=A0A2S8SQY8_9BACT|nr:hypothetical protein [Abditibacterium utsteinense]PQV63213.1 hypothetical protein B1R32_11438 [Abditibacterium utsteinense]
MKLFSLASIALLSAPVLAQPQNATQTPALEAPIAWKSVIGADGKPLAPRTSGDFEVELRAAAWCRVQQFDSPNYRSSHPQSNFDDEGFAGFAIQPRLFDRDGKLIEDPYMWSGQIKLDNGESAGGSWSGDKSGGVYFGGLTPYAKKGTIQLSFADPKRPPEAEGRFETSFLFADLPYPNEVNTFLPVNKTVETAHGSQITLLGYGRYEPGLPQSADGKDLADAGIYFFVKEVKPKAFPDADLSVSGFKVGARDGIINSDEKDDLKFLTGVGGDLRQGKGRTSNMAEENKTYIFAAPDAPRLLHLQLKYSESHPSWKQNQYFHRVSFPFDFRGYPMPIRDAKFAPLAIAKNQDVEVALDLWQDRSRDKVRRNYLAWFWTRDLKIKDDPSLRWIIQGGSTRPGTTLTGGPSIAQLSDGGTLYRGGDHFGWDRFAWRFRPDGAPVLGSEYRPAVSFFAEALQGQPQKWDMNVTFAQWRLKKHEWNWKAVPLPGAGQKLMLNRVAVSPTGVKVKLVSVAFYSAENHFASIERQLSNGRDNSQGVAISFEANLADLKGPKTFDVFELRNDVTPKPGADWGTMSFGKNDDISGQKSDAKVARWTFIYPLKQLEAKSFDLNVSWDADYPTGRTATFDFSNLPTPAKDRNNQ